MRVGSDKASAPERREFKKAGAPSLKTHYRRHARRTNSVSVRAFGCTRTRASGWGFVQRNGRRTRACQAIVAKVSLTLSVGIQAATIESNTPAARCISRRRAVRAPYIPFLGPVRATKVLRQAIEQATRRGRGVRATITQEDLRHRIASIAHSSHT